MSLPIAVAGTFFLLQYLEDSIGGDPDKRSQVVQEVNAVVDKARKETKFAGVPVFQFQKTDSGPVVQLVTTDGLLDVAIA